jgi:hypothetical protein
MGRIDLRVGKLEAQTITRGSEPYVRVIAEQGEAPDDCIQRHGHDPDRPRAHYIVRLIIEPEPRTKSLCGGGDGQD